MPEIDFIKIEYIFSEWIFVLLFQVTLENYRVKMELAGN